MDIMQKKEPFIHLWLMLFCKLRFVHDINFAPSLNLRERMCVSMHIRVQINLMALFLMIRVEFNQKCVPI